MEAARSPYFVAWDIGLELLCRLAARHQAARDAMSNLMNSARSPVRSRILGAVHDRLPKQFCIDLVNRGLADRSKRVRGAAADCCRRFILREMLDALSQVASRETDAGVKFELEYAMGLIRDEYFVYARPDGTRAFVVRISDGYPPALLYPVPGYCAVADIEGRGPAAVAEEIRRAHNRTMRRFRWDTEDTEQGQAGTFGVSR
jgi:hypothetical protein